jgi:hypothetical protein
VTLNIGHKDNHHQGLGYPTAIIISIASVAAVILTIIVVHQCYWKKVWGARRARRSEVAAQQNSSVKKIISGSNTKGKGLRGSTATDDTASCINPVADLIDAIFNFPETDAEANKQGSDSGAKTKKSAIKKGCLKTTGCAENKDCSNCSKCKVADGKKEKAKPSAADKTSPKDSKDVSEQNSSGDISTVITLRIRNRFIET